MSGKLFWMPGVRLTFTAFFTLFLSLALFAGTKADKLRSSYSGPRAKYVFYFIADGVGLSQISLTEFYGAALSGKVGIKRLSFSEFPNLALTNTYATDSNITDSAAAGTALATGHKTSFNTLGMDSSGRKKLTSIARMAKDRGMKVGIISTVHINDATPSVFYSGQPKRKMAKDIARELLDSGFDLFAGGGLQKVSDQKTFLEAGGYSFIDNRKDFQRLKAGSKHYIACPIRDESQACRYSIDKGSKEIRLSEFTKKAIDLLKGPEGFFLMVEGGKIDWACHANDARTAIDELLAFDAAVREAIKFYKQHPEDTAIIVVADHETGGLGLGISETYYKSHLERLMHQKMSIQELDIKVAEYRSKTPAGKARLEDLLPIIKKGFGLGDASKGLALSEQDIHELRLAFNASMSGLKDDTIYAKYSEALSSKVATILSKKAGLGWTTFYHTASPVVAFAQGTGSTLFSGFIDNTDVAKNIITIMGFDR